MELLVVVAVIGVLSGVLIAVINTSSIQGRARDADRISDLKSIQAALELYYADNRRYPRRSWSWENTGSAGSDVRAALEGSYMNTFPVDPITGMSGGNMQPCGNQNQLRYNYRTDGGANYYILTAIMEEEPSNDGYECDKLSNWTSGRVDSCGGDRSMCYGTQNP